MKTPAHLPEATQHTLAQLEAAPLSHRIGVYLYEHGSPYRAKQNGSSLTNDLWLLGNSEVAPEYSSKFVEALYSSIGEVRPTPAEPDLLVTVPVAIQNETPNQIDVLCRQIEKAARPLGNVSVLMWANMKYDGMLPDKKIRGLVKDAGKKTANLQAQLHARPRTNVRYMTGFQTGDKAEMRMSDIRYSFMAVMLERVRQLGHSAALPVMWVDADTTHLSKNAFTGVVDALETHAFAHPRVAFSAEWAANLPPNDTARTFMLQQLLERKRRKHYGVNYRDIDYPEESGLAFTIDTYLKARGVSTSAPMNEAPGLIHNYAARVSTGAPGRIEPYAFFKDVADAQLIASGRRVLDMVAAYGYDGFEMVRENTRRYVPWCDTTAKQQALQTAITPEMALRGYDELLAALPAAERHRTMLTAQRLWNSPSLKQ